MMFLIDHAILMNNYKYNNIMLKIIPIYFLQNLKGFNNIGVLGQEDKVGVGGS